MHRPKCASAAPAQTNTRPTCRLTRRTTRPRAATNERFANGPAALHRPRVAPREGDSHGQARNRQFGRLRCTHLRLRERLSGALLVSTKQWGSEMARPSACTTPHRPLRPWERQSMSVSWDSGMLTLHFARALHFVNCQGSSMNAKEVPLPFWQNPQCYPLVTYQRDIVVIRTTCFVETNGEPEMSLNQVGEFRFAGVTLIAIERPTLRPSSQFQARHRSSLFQLERSKLLLDHLKRSKGDTAKADESLHHYIVGSHDCDLNLIAKSVQIGIVAIDVSQVGWLDV